MGLILKMTLSEKQSGLTVTEGKRVATENHAKDIMAFTKRKYPGKYEKFELFEEHKFIKELK